MKKGDTYTLEQNYRLWTEINNGKIKNMTIPTRIWDSSNCEVTPCKYKQGAPDIA